jgi:hypothetical protein
MLVIRAALSRVPRMRMPAGERWKSHSPTATTTSTVRTSQ